MSELDDHELLAAFARNGAEAAFAALVARHVSLVYSTAYRFTSNPHHAEEIAAAVFIILARKAGQLSPRTVLSGWLYQTARLTAANFLKSEHRRQCREQEVYMQSTLNAAETQAWEQLAPLLDEAMGTLGETDRNAVVLRYFENRSAAEIGVALRMNEETARRRVNRAVEKLQRYFTKRGVALSAGLIAGAVSANSVSAAPVGLATTISAVAITKGAAAGTSTLTLVKGALKIMAWTKAKMAIAVGTTMLLTVATTSVAVLEQTRQPEESLDARIERLSRPGTTVKEAIALLGEPAKYAAGTNTFSKAKLPVSYLLCYPNGVEVAARRGRVVELRSLRPGPGFSYHGKLRLNSTLEEVLDIVGPPLETIPNQSAKALLGQSLTGDPGVLYTEIGGEPGYCYYWRPDQNVRFLFKQNRVIALIVDVAN